MKKIYNCLFPILCLLVLSACDDKEGEVVGLKYEGRNITVTGVNPPAGNVGELVTVNGRNFGISKELVEVFVGSRKLEVLECQDDQITAKVPDGTTAGKVSLTVLGEKIATDLAFDVLGLPGVTEWEPKRAFVGDDISFTGHDFGVTNSRVKLLFSGAKSPVQAAIVSCENEKFVARVPEGAISGVLTLTIGQTNVNVEGGFVLLERSTFTTVTPGTGFAGSRVTLAGTNFGSDKEHTVVRFAGMTAEVVSCTEEQIEVIVPEGVEAGEEYAVTIETPYEKIAEKRYFTVLASPVISKLSATKGYVDDEVGMSGAHLGMKAEDVKVMLGKAEARIISCKDDEIRFKVPAPVEGESFGEKAVVFSMFGLDISAGTFVVYETPTVTSIRSKNILSSVLAKVGDVVVITGTQLERTEKIWFGETEVTEKISASDESMEVKVPVGFSGGKVKLKFEGIPTVYEGVELKALVNGTDISEYVLKNNKQPFERDEATAKEWATASDWKYNSTFRGNGGTLQYPGKTGDPAEGVIALLKWGKQNYNGKMYQAFKLPKGKYDVELTVNAVGGSLGNYKAFFVVSSGTEEKDIPDLNWGTWTSNTDKILKDFDITGKTAVSYPYTEKLSVDLTEEENDVIISFVTYLKGSLWITASSVLIKYVE